jgi:predicted transcriptional regulator
MSSITFNIDDAKKAILEETAKSLNISMDDLVNEAIENFLTEKEQRFQLARNYVRTRYRELYKRLA